MDDFKVKPTPGAHIFLSLQSFHDVMRLLTMNYDSDNYNDNDNDDSIDDELPELVLI